MFCSVWGHLTTGPTYAPRTPTAGWGGGGLRHRGGGVPRACAQPKGSHPPPQRSATGPWPQGPREDYPAPVGGVCGAEGRGALGGQRGECGDRGDEHDEDLGDSVLPPSSRLACLCLCRGPRLQGTSPAPLLPAAPLPPPAGGGLCIPLAPFHSAEFFLEGKRKPVPPQ